MSHNIPDGGAARDYYDEVYGRDQPEDEPDEPDEDDERAAAAESELDRRREDAMIDSLPEERDL